MYLIGAEGSTKKKGKRHRRPNVGDPQLPGLNL